MKKIKPKYFKDFFDEFKEFSREKLRTALEGLTPEEIVMFNRMHGSIDVIPFEKMAWAYAQVMRTYILRAEKKEGLDE